MWVCDPSSKAWQQMPDHCACPPGFACGGTGITCMADEVCFANLAGGFAGDAGPSPVFSYSCLPLPLSCGADACACVENSVEMMSGGLICTSCNVDSVGHMTIQCAGA
jgi:hypothetical protein